MRIEAAEKRGLVQGTIEAPFRFSNLPTAPYSVNHQIVSLDLDWPHYQDANHTAFLSRMNTYIRFIHDDGEDKEDFVPCEDN